MRASSSVSRTTRVRYGLEGAIANGRKRETRREEVAEEEKVVEIDQVRGRAVAGPAVFHSDELHRCSTIISTRVETIIFSSALTIEGEINGSASP